jgi:radical SAM protein with 4Fe4S-binding SPASM domain
VKPYEAFFHLLFRDLDPGDFPFRFTVEITNHCNLRCTTCPRLESGRGYGNVEHELFTRLARQAAGRDVLFYPQGFGESFLHPRYHEMLRYLHAVGVRAPVVITNGSYLDEDACRALVEAAPRVVIVSLDGADPEEFERVRVRASYDEIVANTRSLFRVRAELGRTTPQIILSVVGTERVRASMPRFEDLWQPLLGEGDQIYVCAPITWVGAKPDLESAAGPPPERRTPCRMLYKTLTVYYDGRTTPCCYDHACELEIGNANDETVEEMWKGERLARLRSLHEEGRFDEIPLCGRCRDYVP